MPTLDIGGGARRAAAALALALAAASRLSALGGGVPASAPAAGAATAIPPRAVLEPELSACALIGLDRAFRGASIAAGASLRAGPLAPALRARLDWDAGLGGLIAGAELALALGPELRILAGFELPLGSLGVESRGRRVELAPEGLPSRFALAVLLAEPETAPRRNAPRLALEAELGWSAYRILASAAGDAAEGLAGFAAGFRASLGLRLRWGGETPARP